MNGSVNFIYGYQKYRMAFLSKDKPENVKILTHIKFVSVQNETVTNIV